MFEQEFIFAATICTGQADDNMAHPIKDNIANIDAVFKDVKFAHPNILGLHHDLLIVKVSFSLTGKPVLILELKLLRAVPQQPKAAATICGF